MTAEEFSNVFDVLVNSHNVMATFGEGSNSASGVTFDEYEKSLYLTKAQESVVTTIYNGGATADGFEATEEYRRYLANLVEEARLSPITNTSGLVLGIGSNSKFFTLPEDLWFITYEAVDLEGNVCKAFTPMDVYPVTQDDYNRTKRNPFRGPNDRRALRLDLSNGVVEIVSKYTVKDYYVRYLRKPKPIVLVDLPDGLTIDGQSKQSNPACELHESLHQRILELAVTTGLQDKVATATTAKEKKTASNA